MLNNAAKYDFDTKNWFRRILNFIKLWARTGQYALAKIYADINRGKYYGIKPNEDNVERFKSIYSDEGPNFEVNGHQFKDITKTKQFDDIVKVSLMLSSNALLQKVNPLIILILIQKIIVLKDLN